MALINSLTSGVSALKSFAKGIEVIGSNIGNVNTAGFKGSRVDYSESFGNMLRDAQSSPSGAGSNVSTSQVGGGVQVGTVGTDFSQGSVSRTGVATDLAIVGNGFFLVEDSINDQQFATRAGNFRQDDRGFLVTDTGFRVQGLTGGNIAYDVTEVGGEMVFTPSITSPSASGDIDTSIDLSVGSGLTNSTGGAFTDAQIEANAPGVESFSIDESGNINIFMSNGDSFARGQILLTNFRDPQALKNEGNGLYSGFDAAGQTTTGDLTATDNAPGTNGFGSIRSRHLELSNVDLTDQFANIITTQRSFQAGARIVTVSDEILNEVVNLKR